MLDLIVENAIFADGTKGSLTVKDGVISEIGVRATEQPAQELIDAGGQLVIPAFTDGHVHLDKTLLGLPFIPHIKGESVRERIDAEKQLRKNLPMSVEERGAHLIERLISYGTLSVRSHVDIDREVGLKGLESLLTLKQRFVDRMDIQIVAFPQSGIMCDPGTAGLLDDALGNGADLIGGLDPAGIDQDINGHLDVVFSLAEKHGKGIDLHLHDGGPLGSFQLRQMAERTLATGLTGQVAVSHAFCLGALERDEFTQTANLLAKADIAIMTTGPGPVPMPPVKPLLEHNVRVFCGSDNIRDAWSPFGNGDLLERASIICDRQDFRSDEDLELAFKLVTEAPAQVIGKKSGKLKPGQPADFLIVDAQSVAEAVATRPAKRQLFRNGRSVG